MELSFVIQICIFDADYIINCALWIFIQSTSSYHNISRHLHHLPTVLPKRELPLPNPNHPSNPSTRPHSSISSSPDSKISWIPDVAQVESASPDETAPGIPMEEEYPEKASAQEPPPSHRKRVFSLPPISEGMRIMSRFRIPPISFPGLAARRRHARNPRHYSLCALVRFRLRRDRRGTAGAQHAECGLIYRLRVPGKMRTGRE